MEVSIPTERAQWFHEQWFMVEGLSVSRDVTGYKIKNQITKRSVILRNLVFFYSY